VGVSAAGERVNAMEKKGSDVVNEGINSLKEGDPLIEKRGSTFRRRGIHVLK